MRWAVSMIALMLLTACAPPDGGAVDGPVASPPAAAEPSGPGAPAAAMPEITLTPGPAVVTLETPAGDLWHQTWIGPSHLLVSWNPPVDGPRPATFFLINPETGLARQLVTADLGGWLAAAAGPAVLTWARSSDGCPAGVSVIHLDTGHPESAYCLDPAAPQWPGGDVHGWSFAEPPLLPAAFRAGPETFVVVIPPKGYSLWGQPWGKVLAVDTAARQVHLLAERGSLAAALPDGSLLVRRGWIDGELVLFSPPYGDPPMPVDPPGPWKWAAVASQAGDRVAWWELAAPAGDWSHELPNDCCSGDPPPTLRGIAVWDRATGEVHRLSLAGLHWHRQLVWRRDGSGLLFATTTDADGGRTDIYQADLAGRRTPLTSHPWAGHVSFHTEAADGTLYYTITGRLGQTWSTLVGLPPGSGAVVVLQEGIPGDWSVDEQARWFRRDGKEWVVRDLATGAETRYAEGFANRSPDGRWAIGDRDRPGALPLLRTGAP